jgi:hypothetical protein
MAAGSSLILPLASAAMLAQSPAGADDSSERFAKALVTSYVCEHLGYKVDYDGLAGRGEAVRERMVAAGASPDAALLRIRADVQAERDRFNRVHGAAVWVLGDNGMTVTGVSEGYDAQYRFQKTFADRCEALRDAGGFLEAPAERLSGAALSRKTRAAIIRLTRRD